MQILRSELKEWTRIWKESKEVESIIYRDRWVNALRIEFLVGHKGVIITGVN